MFSRVHGDLERRSILSMLKYFFDCAEPENAALFEGLKIAENKTVMKGWQGKYPVVLIGFKE
ncbi:MAG: hypothetical protein ACD_44C00228G0003 [uncultured bacterium]|nr:MAG: hypothetical protein ACD_44C00228G0003 [uncultured bacterium]